jgi:hypothetical protein
MVGAERTLRDYLEEYLELGGLLLRALRAGHAENKALEDGTSVTYAVSHALALRKRLQIISQVTRTISPKSDAPGRVDGIIAEYDRNLWLSFRESLQSMMVGEAWWFKPDGFSKFLGDLRDDPDAAIREVFHLICDMEDNRLIGESLRDLEYEVSQAWRMIVALGEDEARYLSSALESIGHENETCLELHLRAYRTANSYYGWFKLGDKTIKDLVWPLFTLCRRREDGFPVRGLDFASELPHEMRERIVQVVASVVEAIGELGLQGAADFFCGLKGEECGRAAGVSAPINTVPKGEPGICRDLVLAFAHGDEYVRPWGLANVLRELRIHLIRCGVRPLTGRATKVAILFTDHWRERSFALTYRKEFQAWKDQGVILLGFLVTGKGSVTPIDFGHETPGAAGP